MNRLWIMALLPALAPLTLAAAEPERTDCFVQGEIAQKAADLRLEGKRVRRAERLIKRDYKDGEARFAKAVPLLVDWVFTLPDAQVDDQVGASFQAACEAQ